MTTSKRIFTADKERLRNLKQNQGMSDSEFEVWFADTYPQPDADDYDPEELDKRIDEILKKLGDDYDLDDMKSNDMIQLKAFILASIQLTDLERKAQSLTKGIDSDSILVLEKINRIMSSLRADMSMISTDLQLTKKIRSQSKDVSVQQKWNELTTKAADFYRRKSLFIFCPNCRTLLSTIWLLYTENVNNEIRLECERCGTVSNVKLFSLYDKGNKNLEDVVIP